MAASDADAAQAAQWAASEMDRRMNALQEESKKRLAEIEERVEGEIRARVKKIVWWMAAGFAALFLSSLGALLISVWSSTKDVNSEVIALQGSIIAAQSTIRESETALREQTTRLVAANAAMAAASSEMRETTRQLGQVRAGGTTAGGTTAPRGNQRR